MIRFIIATVACAGLVACTTAPARDDAAPDLRIAITLDDLPWASADNSALPEARFDDHRRLLAAIEAAGAPVVGFVNEGKLEVDGAVDPRRLALLDDWLDADVELANHTHGHLDLHAVGVDAYCDDVGKGERQLRPLLAARGLSPRWFRHPYLRTGTSVEDKAAVVTCLSELGYRVAPVSVDNSDWVWARAYDRAQANGDRESIVRLRHDYIAYMLAKLDYYRQQARDLLGRDLAQIWLMHANRLNADCYGDLVAAARAEGWRTITLDEAMADPAYRRPDGYTGRFGPSWIHRWAIAEGRPRAFFGDEPPTPRWVLDLAGLDSE